MTPADYDAWYDSPRGRWIGEIEYRLVDDQLAARVGARILDVGCGTGWFTRRFASVRGLHVTGIDVDAAALDFARRHDHLASYLRADARRLPFADGSFDGVVSITALCFVPDWPTALAEIVRVCRSRFVVGLLNHHSLLRLEKGRGGGTGAYRGAHWHTRREVLAALARLATADVTTRTAILMPSGSTLAQRLEVTIGQRTSLGSFLVVAGNKVG